MIKEKQKEVYTSPLTEVLVVRFEGVVCTSGDMSINDWTDDGDPLSF